MLSTLQMKALQVPSSSKIVRTRATYVNYQPFLQSTYCAFLLYHCSIKRSTPGLLVVNIKTNMVCKELHSTRGGQIIQTSCTSSKLCILVDVKKRFLSKCLIGIELYHCMSIFVTQRFVEIGLGLSHP